MQEKKTGVCVGRLWNNIIENRKEGQKMQIEGDQCRRCLECGYKWNTVEVYADEWERLSRKGR